MKNILTIITLLFAASLMKAQDEDRVYFYDGSWAAGTIIEVIPDSSVTLLNCSGETETYIMLGVKEIVKEYYKGNMGSQTLQGSVAVSGGLSFAKYGSRHNSLIDLSFKFFPFSNIGIGVFIRGDGEGGGFSILDNMGVNFGGAALYYFGKGPHKPFAGIEGKFQSEFDNVSEVGIVIGYNYAISRNLAIQPLIKKSFIKLEDDSKRGHYRLLFGIDIAAYIF